MFFSCLHIPKDWAFLARLRTWTRHQVLILAFLHFEWYILQLSITNTNILDSASFPSLYFEWTMLQYSIANTSFLTKRCRKNYRDKHQLDEQNGAHFWMLSLGLELNNSIQMWQGIHRNDNSKLTYGHH